MFRHRADGSVTLFPTDAELLRQEKVETAAEYKPPHGGYPTYPRVKVMGNSGVTVQDDFADAHGGHSTPPTSPIPGSEWDASFSEFIKRSIPKPAIYFDAVRMSMALEQIAHDAQAKSWKLVSALRLVRQAETNYEMVKAGQTLYDIYNEYMNRNLAAQMNVNDQANTIDATKYPHQEPSFWQKLMNSFKRSDA